MENITVLYGQSNFDICLQVYGSLDRMIKLCKDNSVSDINLISKKTYAYDEALVVDKNITGYQYATNPNP